MADSDRSVLTADSDGHFIVYNRRWYVLSVVCILNITNAMIWISFAPIADITAKYYSQDLSAINWLSLVYMVASIPFGFASQWLLDTMGLRAGLSFGAWLNFTGAVLRVVSTIDGLASSYRFPIVMVGQSISACAQPFVLFAPTKLAALWFKTDQRATANMIASMSNPVGILLANVISPAIANGTSDMLKLQIAYAVPAGVGALMSLAVTSSTPPTPPTSSAGQKSESYSQGLKQIVRNRHYWVLAVCFGLGLALFTTFTTLLQQILCPWGYTDDFAGLCGALLIGGGVVGAGVAGVYVDKTKKFEEVAKVCFCLASLSGLAFAVIFKTTGSGAAIVATTCMFGLFGFAIFPVCMELAVETTYPVAEATSAGFLIIIGQGLGIVLIIMMQSLAQNISPPENSKCLTAPQDYWIPTLVSMGLSAVSSAGLTIFYKCPYKRLRSEQHTEAERILNFSQNNHAENSSLPR